MRVFLGLHFGGAALVEAGEPSPAGASIGRVTWGPAQLLRDLELRLGLGSPGEPHALRVARWQARLAEIAPRGRYYSQSFEVEPVGTAEALLRLRDSLIEAGWDGQSIRGGGRRLDALCELEQLRDLALPAGNADRLTRVAQSLGDARVNPYREVMLAESIELWPARWQAVLRALERAGGRLTQLRVDLPGARPDCDLGRLQAALAEQKSEHRVAIEGDGSCVRVAAETVWEAGRAAAALLESVAAGRAVVIRQHETSALDGALAAHGLPTQGLSSISPWRAAQQVLPLALELAFEPKDPYRVLELLTLPLGPFQGRAGHELARALGQSPGIGGPAWEAAKSMLTGSEQEPELVARHLATIAAWLEAPGADPLHGAAKADVLAVVERVRTWLLSRIASTPGDGTLLAAAQQAGALLAALAADPRDTLRLVEVRKLVRSVLSTGSAVSLMPEQAGRFDHVSSPAALWTARDVVVWWSFDRPSDVVARLPWRQSELAALRAAGIHFPDPHLLLAEEARAARRAFTCATERLILVSAREAAGSSLPNHSLWDELVTRAQLDEQALPRLVVGARELREPARTASLTWSPRLVEQPLLQLPGGHHEWSVKPGCVSSPESVSYASLDALLGCPLRWALRYAAGTYPGGHGLPALFQLNGSLGHRLIEVLHHERAFELAEPELRSRASRALAELFQREGAILLRAGMSFERRQLERQLADSVVELGRILREAGLRIAAVEHPIDVTYANGKLEGRIDLVVSNGAGETVIVDTKWGAKRYRDALKSGHSLQLALYAFAHATAHARPYFPDAAYFSLKQGKLFGLPSRLLPNAEVVDGPSLADTWKRAERTLACARRSIHDGTLAATGLRGSLPLLQSHGVPDAQHSEHFAHPVDASCTYCDFDGLCGRRWEERS